MDYKFSQGLSSVSHRFDLTKQGFDHIASTNQEFLENFQRTREQCADSILYLGRVFFGIQDYL